MSKVAIKSAEIEILKAQVADAEAISKLGRQTFVESFAYVYQDNPGILERYLDNAFSTDKISQSLAKPNNHYYIAYVNDRAVGYMKIKENSKNDKLGYTSQMQLQKIYVVKSSQNDGVGAALLEKCFDMAEAVSPVMLWLSVLDKNEGAHRFYDRFGMKVVGSHPHNFEDLQVNFDVMAIEI